MLVAETRSQGLPANSNQLEATGWQLPSSLRYRPRFRKRARIVTFYRCRCRFFCLGPLAPRFFLRLLFFFCCLASVVRTHQHLTSLQILLQQVWAAALRTFLGYRLIGRGELALGIIRTSVEEVSASPRLLLHQLAIFAQGAIDADVVLLNVFAFRIPAAGDEFSITSVTQHHVPVAFRTGFFQCYIRHFFALVESARGLAVRIPGAGHKLPETATLQHHNSPAVFAIFFLRRSEERRVGKECR